MKRSFHYILLATGLFTASCGNSRADKALKRVYMKEHIENCNIITHKNFVEIERTRIFCKNNPQLLNKLKSPIDKTHELHTYLKDEFYPVVKTKKTSPFAWKKIIEKEAYILHYIDSTFPSILFMKVHKPMMEIDKLSDSDELKLSKHFTNCMLISKYMVDILSWPNFTVYDTKWDLQIIKNISDTANVGDTLDVQFSFFFNKDIVRYYIVKEINDIQIKQFDRKTGNFEALITGQKPSCALAYFDPVTLKEVLYEVDF